MQVRQERHRRDRLIRLPEVESVTGCKKSTIYRLMKEGKFPPCVRITSRTVAWPETAVLGWIQMRIQGQALGLKGVGHA